MGRILNKLQTIKVVLTKADWIMFRYDIRSQTAYPFDLYLPNGYLAHYEEDSVTIVKASSAPSKSRGGE